MSIQIVCNSCNKTITAPDHVAGKRGKCPGCNELITIPHRSAATDSTGKIPRKNNTPQKRAATTTATSDNINNHKKLRFTCSSCGKVIVVPVSAAGKRGKCPGCQTIVTVPPCEKNTNLTSPENKVSNRPEKQIDSKKPDSSIQSITVSKEKISPSNETSQKIEQAGTALNQPDELEESNKIVETSPQQKSHQVAVPEKSLPEEPVKSQLNQDDFFFAEEGLWGTIAEDFSPETIYHGTMIKGDVCFPFALTTQQDTISIQARQISGKELSSFVVQMFPWFIGITIAPIQHTFGFFFTGFLILLSILSPWNIPFLIIEGIGHFIGIFTSTLVFLLFIPQYIKAVIFLITRSPYTFVPRGIQLEDNSVFSRFTSAEISQVIRIEVSQKLFKRIISKIKKQEEEDMGLVGIVIGLFRLAMLPISIPFSIVSGIFRMFGIGKKKRVMFAFIKGPSIDMQEPESFISRIKKARKEKTNERKRIIYLMNTPIDCADTFQAEMERRLDRKIDFIDDKLAKTTIWRKFC